jgi:hypothetical protein
MGERGSAADPRYWTSPLESLAALDARKVQVELKFFAGLTVEETANVFNVSPDTVARDWRMARTWLLRELSAARV